MVSALCARSKNRTKLKQKRSGAKGGCWQSLVRLGFFLGLIFVTQHVVSLYSSVVERQSCKLKVLGSIPSGGFLLLIMFVCMSSVHVACHQSMVEAWLFAEALSVGYFLPRLSSEI